MNDTEVTVARPRRPREPSTFARARTATGDFLRRVYKKAEQDQIFFMGGAIAFNVLVAIVPLALAAVGVAGFFLQGRAEAFGNPAEPVVRYLLQVLPPVSNEFAQYMRQILNEIITNATGLFTIGTLVFAWLATRLVGTLRTALREIFDIQQDRGIIRGKLFDLQMVFVAGTLLVANIAITLALTRVTDLGIAFLHIDRGSLVRALIGRTLAFLTIWSMFVLIYRYLPARRIQWRTAITSATFTAIMFELMKGAFALYFRNANYASTYGALGFLAIVVIYVYYMALAFIIGGEVGQVAALQRIRRRQKERLG
ncbi:MAG TPA: YihY/virulence factor BrkB family protein [Longimicrobiales bacterium]